MNQIEERRNKYLEMPEEFKSLVEIWPWGHVCFADFGEFTGNAMGSGRLRNLTNQGDGPPTFRMGKKRCVDKIEGAFWLWQHTEKMNGKEN